MSKITVYRFQVYNMSVGAKVLSPRWGTMEAIKSVKREPLLETAIEVDPSVVQTDMPGFTAIGWEPAGVAGGCDGGVEVGLRGAAD